MAFWIFLTTCNMLIPVIMISFGKIFERKAPSKIALNKKFDKNGYRNAE